MTVDFSKTNSFYRCPWAEKNFYHDDVNAMKSLSEVMESLDAVTAAINVPSIHNAAVVTLALSLMLGYGAWRNEADNCWEFSRGPKSCDGDIVGVGVSPAAAFCNFLSSQARLMWGSDGEFFYESLPGIGRTFWYACGMIMENTSWAARPANPIVYWDSLSNIEPSDFHVVSWSDFDPEHITLVE